MHVRLFIKWEKTEGGCMTKRSWKERDDVKMRAFIQLVTAVTVTLKMKNINYKKRMVSDFYTDN